jgi:hypothetical protein
LFVETENKPFKIMITTTKRRGRHHHQFRRIVTNGEHIARNIFDDPRRNAAGRLVVIHVVV